MIRLDSQVSLMVASEEQAETIEQALKTRPVVLICDIDLIQIFSVVVLHSSEEHASEAKKLLS